PRVEGTVMLLFDVSGSMAAEDFSPNRLEAAKQVAREFVQRQPTTIRIGVVAFSTSGFAVQPPTNNQEEILSAIDRLRPQLGTSLGQGIFATLNALAAEADQSPRSESDLAPAPGLTPVPPGTVAPAVIVMLTDGENNQAPDPVEAAQAAADQGVRIHTIGVGSAAGTLLKVNGFTVHTQLDEAMMRRVAEISGGQYFSAENEEELKDIYENLTPQLVVKPEMIEITALLAGVSIIILVLGGLLSLLWFGRIL
ncbi:MAG TPA: VWA domain-containing protein, partial [Anaerolineaceae bacterium]|nr:VWA domain-containing protein [Anaerolineaceae bacterium]